MTIITLLLFEHYFKKEEAVVIYEPQKITRESLNSFRTLAFSSGIPVPFFADTGITGRDNASALP